MINLEIKNSHIDTLLFLTILAKGSLSKEKTVRTYREQNPCKTPGKGAESTICPISLSILLERLA